MKKQDYYLGLDIGTDSVGYAVTNTEYDLLKWKGDPMWGVTLFSQNETANAERRSLRIARRRLTRRKQRVALVQELFAGEIAKVDPKFYIRMQESALWREDASEPYSVFNDEGYTDKEYHAQYPTIHHLIVDLMKSDNPHDVRLVYLACAWLVAHRGHFLSDINKDNIAEMTNFGVVYRALSEYYVNSRDNAVILWNEDHIDEIKNVLLKHIPVTRKYRELSAILYADGKAPKLPEEYPYGIEPMWKLLCGSKVALKDLFPREDYGELGSVSLNVSDEELEDLIGKLGDDAELIVRMKALYDQILLTDVLSGYQTISEAKVAIYEQHKTDLQNLKSFVKKYIPAKYNDIFRADIKENYQSYVYHAGKKNQKLPDKKAGKEMFSDWLRKTLKTIEPEEEDKAFFDDMILRLETMTFLPKQKDGDNRVIPYQLYWHELRELLKKAEGYLDFLGQKDADGLSVTDKLLSIMEFRIPYFVGPMNESSAYAWIKREKERIYPWNFEKVVDLSESENRFINRMLNRCSYLPEETVLPKDSLLYHRYMVLNEINNIRIDGMELSVDQKQTIYNELFAKRRKVTYKALIDFMTCRQFMMPGQSVKGIDIKINADLKPQHDFARLMGNGVLTEDQVEKVIERITYTTDKIRLKKWLAETYPQLPKNDIDYIARLNYKDFGRLSHKLLVDFEGYDKHTGEVATIMSLLWTTNRNLMELMSDRYSFAEEIKKQQDEYYATHALKLDERLNEMWLPNAVKRPVLQALKLTREIKGLVGCAPKKVFVEVTRGATEEQRNKRTSSRQEQILELYKKCRDEDVRILKQELESLGERVDDKLRGDALFLYFMQQGRSMYSGEKLDLSKLGTAEYNIDHIYPESKSGDDSLLNNKVLVLSTENGEKGDRYPIDSGIRSSMRGFWDELHKIGAINDEKYRRLTRSTPFTEEEQLGFVGRQLTQTSQSVKAVAELLQEYFPETEIVYTKARLASDFRQEFGILKSRIFNDLHHAKDAYLNIVAGNVFNMRFSKRWFSPEQDYSIKTRPLFTHPVICGGETVWDGEKMLAKVIRTCARNNAKETIYSYTRGGGLFDMNPLKAAKGLHARKQDLPAEKYGGHDNMSVSFFLPVKYTVGKKSDVMIMSVQTVCGEQVMKSEEAAITYATSRLEQILGKAVTNVSLPLGLRKIKINTVLDLDGYRACITGSANKGRTQIMSSVVPFAADNEVQNYVKRLERYSEKVKNNKNYVYDEKYDKINKEYNLKVYGLYLNKLSSSIFKKKINNVYNTLRDGEEKFGKLTIGEQVQVLLNIHELFGRKTGGVDLTLIGGSAHTGATGSFSTAISNWKKNYNHAYIVDQSITGLLEKKSIDLFELL